MTPSPNLDPKMTPTTEESEPDTPTTPKPTVVMNGVEYEYEYYYDDYPFNTGRKMDAEESGGKKRDSSNPGGKIDAMQTNDAEVDLNTGKWGWIKRNAYFLRVTNIIVTFQLPLKILAWLICFLWKKADLHQQ